MKTFLAHSRLAVAAVCLLSLSACVVDGPTGPSVPVMPGDNKTLGQFQQDDATCRGFASQQTGISPAAAANQAGVGTAVVSTLVGAAVGALIGTAAGNPAIGAAIGGGAGLLTGAAGTGNAAISAGNVQQRYDVAYQQCMSTTGNKTMLAQAAPPPGYGAPPPGYGAPAPAYYYPPPPPPAYYYPQPYYYYPPPPAYYYPQPGYYAPGIGATFVFGFGGGGRGHYHHH